MPDSLSESLAALRQRAGAVPSKDVKVPEPQRPTPKPSPGRSVLNALPSASELCKSTLRKTLDDLRQRAGNEPILDAMIDSLVLEAQRRGEAQRAAMTLRSVADELVAASRVRRG